MGKAALADLPARAERRAGALQAGEQCPPPHRPKLALEAPGHPPPGLLRSEFIPGAISLPSEITIAIIFVRFGGVESIT